MWRFLREEAGMDIDEVHRDMAEGMLISTMIGLRLVDDYDRDDSISEIFQTCFPTQLTHVLEMIPRGDEPW